MRITEPAAQKVASVANCPSPVDGFHNHWQRAKKENRRFFGKRLLTFLQILNFLRPIRRVSDSQGVIPTDINTAPGGKLNGQ